MQNSSNFKSLKTIKRGPAKIFSSAKAIEPESRLDSFNEGSVKSIITNLY